MEDFFGGIFPDRTNLSPGSEAEAERHNPWRSMDPSPSMIYYSNMSEADVLTVNAVACEACRTKKCKCDRVLPSCGQCTKLGATCTYPQSHKRGFPEGYLAGLEQRLLETEIALFESLALLSSTPNLGEISPDVQNAARLFQQRSTKQSKPSRTEEWRRLPLTSRDQRWQWWEANAKDLGIGYSASPAEYQNVIQTLSQDQTRFYPAAASHEHTTVPSPVQHAVSTPHAQDSPEVSMETQSGWWHNQPPGHAMGFQPPMASPPYRPTSRTDRQQPNVTEADANRAQQLSSSQSRRFF